MSNVEISRDNLIALLGNRTSGAVNVDHPYRIGQAYLIRTVTYTALGRLVEVYEHELVLEDACWVADTGRYMDALKDGKLHEVEPVFYPKIVGRGSIVDADEWHHELPRSQK